MERGKAVKIAGVVLGIGIMVGVNVYNAIREEKRRQAEAVIDISSNCRDDVSNLE